MDIGHLVTLLRSTLQPEERANAEKQLIEVCGTCYRFSGTVEIDILMHFVLISMFASVGK